MSHGVIPNKSYNLEFPKDLSEEFYNSFILGYMDGDGSILRTECRISLVGTEMLCATISEIFSKMFNVHSTISYCHNKKSVPTRCLKVSGKKQVKKILDWLYSCSPVFLKRKYEIYQDLYCSV